MTLPSGFQVLEPFTPIYALTKAADRAALRDCLSRDEAQNFYDRVQPLLEPALAHLDAKPLAEHDEAERRLLQILLTFAHVSLAVEVQRDTESVHTGMRAHMCITRVPADA